MAIIGGIDYGQYASWVKTKGPNGEDWYKVPGNTGMVYDPYLSNLKGNVQLHRDPTTALSEQADAKAKQDALLNAQQNAASPMGQLLPVAGSIAGLVAANQLLKPSVPATDVVTKITNPVVANPASNTLTPQAQTFANQATVTPVSVALNAPAATALQQNADGSVLLSDGTSQVPVTTESMNSFADGGNGFSTPITRAPVANDTLNPDGSVIDKVTGMSVGQWVQGVGGVIQIKSGMDEFKNGSKPVGAIGMAAGAGNIASAAGYGGAQLGAGVTLGAAAGAAGGAYGAYQTAKLTGNTGAGSGRNRDAAVQGAAAGASIGTFIPIPGVGTAIGAAIGGTIGFLGSAAFGSSKDKYQLGRDAVREGLQKYGIIDKDYNGTLADGSKFNFGKDGKGLAKLDFKDPTVDKIAALANIIAAAEGATGKVGTGAAQLYAVAATSNAGGDYNKALTNIQHFAQERKFNLADVQAQIKKEFDEKKITENEYNTWTADASKLFTSQAPTTQSPQAQTFAQTAAKPPVVTTPVVAPPVNQVGVGGNRINNLLRR